MFTFFFQGAMPRLTTLFIYSRAEQQKAVHVYMCKWRFGAKTVEFLLQWYLHFARYDNCPMLFAWGCPWAYQTYKFRAKIDKRLAGQHASKMMTCGPQLCNAKNKCHQWSVTLMSLARPTGSNEKHMTYLTPAYDVCVGSKHVHDLAFALVAPLSPQHHCHLALRGFSAFSGRPVQGISPVHLDTRRHLRDQHPCR